MRMSPQTMHMLSLQAGFGDGKRVYLLSECSGCCSSFTKKTKIVSCIVLLAGEGCFKAEMRTNFTQLPYGGLSQQVSDASRQPRRLALSQGEEE